MPGRFHGFVRPVRIHPVPGAPHSFGLSRLPKGEGMPPYAHKLQFAIDAGACDQFTQGPGQLYARPRCLATGKLPDVSTVTLLDPASGQNGRPLLNFSSASLKYPRVRVRNSRTTQFSLWAPTAVSSNMFIAEMGLDLNSYPGLYIYQGGSAAVAWRSDAASQLTQAWTVATRSQDLLRGVASDKSGNFGCVVAHCDPVAQNIWLRRNGYPIPIVINHTGAPSYGWPNSPTAGVVDDYWIGSRAGSSLFYSGKLAGHYVYCDLTTDEALEIEAWLNDRWAFSTVPKLLFHMVAGDATGSGGSAITGITERVNGIAGATTGTMPKLKTSGLNGLPTLEYDANYSLKFPGVTLPGAHTYVLVSKRTSSAYEFAEHGADTNSNDGSFIYAGGTGMMAVRRTNLYNATDSNFASTSGVWYTRLTSFWGGNTGVMALRNDNFVSGGTPTAGGPLLFDVTADLWVGSRGGSALHMRGEIAELRIYEGGLNFYQASTIMDELKATYGHY